MKLAFDVGAENGIGKIGIGSRSQIDIQILPAGERVPIMDGTDTALEDEGVIVDLKGFGELGPFVEQFGLGWGDIDGRIDKNRERTIGGFKPGLIEN